MLLVTLDPKLNLTLLKFAPLELVQLLVHFLAQRLHFVVKAHHLLLMLGKLGEDVFLLEGHSLVVLYLLE